MKDIYISRTASTYAECDRQLRRLLLRAWAAGAFADDPLGMADLGTFTTLLDQALAVPIVIRIEPPFAGPTTLLKYLGAYVTVISRVEHRRLPSGGIIREEPR